MKSVVASCLLTFAVACGGHARAPEPNVAPVHAVTALWAPAAVESGWTPTSYALVLGSKAPPPPIDVTRLQSTDLPEALRSQLASDALASREPRAAAPSLGAYYAELERTHTPAIVTLDALWAIARVGLGAAIAEAERTLVVPSLARALTSVSASLEAERPNARVDLALGYDAARDLVATARALLDASALPPKDRAAVVASELDRIRTHAGIATSALTGRPMDYSAFDAQHGLIPGDERIGAFRALRVLSLGALTVASFRAAPVDVMQQRTYARASMLFARALAKDVNARSDWARATSVLAFIHGPQDDVGVTAIEGAVRSASGDPADGASFGNVALVDRVRGAACRTPPRVTDLAALSVQPDEPTPCTFRLLGPAVTWDAVAIDWAARSAPAGVDPTLAVAHLLSESRPPERARDDNAQSARIAAIVAPVRARLTAADASGHHASIAESWLDALATTAHASAADAASPFSEGPRASERRLEVALAAWVGMRHDLLPLAQAANAHVDAVPPTDEEATSVEAHPEAIASLASLVRQVDVGLSQRGVFGPDSPARQALALTETLLQAALSESLRAAAGLAPRPEKPWSARFAEVEARVGVSAIAPHAAVVLTTRDGRAVHAATGHARDWLLVTSEPAPEGEHPVVRVGLRVPLREVEDAVRISDVEWQRRAYDAQAPVWLRALDTR